MNGAGEGLKQRQLALFALIPLLAGVATWDLGFALPIIAGGYANYGLPLSWKTVELIPSCFRCGQPTSYNLSFFLLDLVFYTAVGYGIVLLLARTVWREHDNT